MSTSYRISRLALNWLAQLRQRQRDLRGDPAHWQAWRWRIQTKVLVYLVLRYGWDPTLDAAGEPPSCSRSSSPIFPRSESGPSPRSRMEFATILERIADVNRYRVI